MLENLTFLKLQKMSFLIVTGCLIIIFVSGFDLILAKVRDVRRQADIKNIKEALDLYHDKYGYYPESEDDWQGWDFSCSYEGSDEDFLTVLVEENFLQKEVRDPKNDDPKCYRYKKYPAGTYGCNNSFYILQITNFDSIIENIGYGQCPAFDWTDFAQNGYTIQDFD